MSIGCEAVLAVTFQKVNAAPHTGHQGVQLQFIVQHDLPQFRNIEGNKADIVDNGDGFQGLTAVSLYLRE